MIDESKDGVGEEHLGRGLVGLWLDEFRKEQAEFRVSAIEFEVLGDGQFSKVQNSFDLLNILRVFLGIFILLIKKIVDLGVEISEV